MDRLEGWKPYKDWLSLGTKADTKDQAMKSLDSVGLSRALIRCKEEKKDGLGKE